MQTAPGGRNLAGGSMPEKYDITGIGFMDIVTDRWPHCSVGRYQRFCATVDTVKNTAVLGSTPVWPPIVSKIIE